MHLVLFFQVAFANPLWAPFLDKTVKEVCEVLGVNFDASRPKCEPFKLLLYETGSQYVDLLLTR